MAIILDDTERKYLKELLEKHPSTWWPHQKILEKVNEDFSRLHRTSKCKHKFGVYRGKKTCCVYCEAPGAGMGEEWTLVKEISKPHGEV
jgi:GMP synthase-like glutamine amidotransferase